MDHLTYEGKMSLQNGNAVLKGGEEGIMKINVSELVKGNYKVFLKITSSQIEGNEVGFYDDNINSVKWKSLEFKENKQTFYVGDITITDPLKPIRISFKGKHSIELNQVMLVKK